MKTVESANIIDTDADLLVSNYEELRLAAISGRSRCGPGSSVFISQGTFSWLQLMRKVPSTKLPEISKRPLDEAILLPDDIAHNFVETLATMLLHRKREVAYGC